MRTIFHKIASGEVPSDIVHRGGGIIAVNDISPQAPFHIIVFPDPNLWGGDVSWVDKATGGNHGFVHDVLGGLLATCHKIASKNGYDNHRIVINTKTSNDTVPYLHAHVLAGCEFTWPPGVMGDEKVITTTNRDEGHEGYWKSRPTFSFSIKGNDYELWEGDRSYWYVGDGEDFQQPIYQYDGKRWMLEGLYEEDVLKNGFSYRDGPHDLDAIQAHIDEYGIPGGK